MTNKKQNNNNNNDDDDNKIENEIQYARKAIHPMRNVNKYAFYSFDV